MNDKENEKDVTVADTREASSTQGGRYKPRTLWSEIVDGLWQGGTAEDDKYAQISEPYITPDKFDAVYTLYAFANPVDWFVKEYRYGFMDSYDTGFDVETIREIVVQAHTDWKKGKKVLIRCQAGLNRSGLITALVMIRDGYEPQEAIDIMREKRSGYVLMNPVFEEWILSQTTAQWQD